MDEVKFGRILETCMGAWMSFVLNFLAMKLLGAPMTFKSVMFGWAGAFAIAVAINYFCPVMNWVAAWTKGIKGKWTEYIIRVVIFSFIEILFNSIWCLINSGFIAMWPVLFPTLLFVGTIAIFIGLPIFSRVAAFFAKERNGDYFQREAAGNR